MISMPSMAVAVALAAAKASACLPDGTVGGLSRLWAKFIRMFSGTVADLDVATVMGDV
jgi:hypothetical protein